jgi:hypothetical protein
MSYLGNDRRICWSRPRAASSAKQRFKIHRSFRRHTALLALCSGHFWQSVSLRLSGRALTSSSKANSSARPTSGRTARARNRRRPKSLRGPSAPTSCASSIAANPSRKRLLPLLRGKHPKGRTRSRTRLRPSKEPPGFAGDPFFLLFVAQSWLGSRPNSENTTHAAPSYSRCAPAGCRPRIPAKCPYGRARPPFCHRTPERLEIGHEREAQLPLPPLPD